MVDLAKRGFLLGGGALIIASPAIVRASSLMAIKPLPFNAELELHRILNQEIQKEYDQIIADIIVRTTGQSIAHDIIHGVTPEQQAARDKFYNDAVRKRGWGHLVRKPL